MITFAKWLIRFIVWILLYYIIVLKISNSIFELDITSLKCYNITVLIVSIVMSFLSSFWNKLISWKNIKYHVYSILILVIIPVLLQLLNFSIKIINWITQVVNAPQIMLPNIKFSMKYCSSCNIEHLNSLGMIYLFITGIILCMYYFNSYEEYYWEYKEHYYDEGWDDDLE